ncbi:MAG: 4-(cytidine 5'-diphospho)-2-C-methyl-D-erythritol kinase [Hyphomonas sp.]|jgi:4-diphosphocytidyl-2-C-methyl-D-erythritol kinase|uniref:4-(cytidine 5'-diphospho)-2-C-methyl-D-erythritol kinase n=1 Tax=Hyphomonas sp. TaxID=87 RepID=UPI003265AF97
MPTSLAPAKVNLFLHVGAVQQNGRHPLDSLIMFAGSDAADRVSAEPADTLTLDIAGPCAAHLDADDDNLVLRAARALCAREGRALGATLTLDKHLPVAAGIGGGSADAGAALRVLQELWSLDSDLVRQVAAPLGGDVPVALEGRTALMQGEGEIVHVQTGLPQLPAVLVNPSLDCPTGPVFRAFDEGAGGTGFAALEAVPDLPSPAEVIEWLKDQRNDLEPPAIRLVPEIRGVLDTLNVTPGARLARMSGSGATCFALFETIEAAQSAARTLERAHPSWWIRATSLGDAR